MSTDESLIQIALVENLNPLDSHLKELFADLGLQIQTFAPNQFIRHLETSPNYDLIILDYSFPQKSGTGIVKLIRQRKNNDTPIFVVSDNSERNVIVEMYMFGVSDYVIKPYHPDVLIARLNSHLKLSRLQKELKMKNQTLEKLDQTKNEFIGIAAHDLRNPLMVIRESAELILDGLCDSPEEQQDFLMSIKNASNKMLNLIEDLLSLNKIESGQLNIQKIDVLLKDYISQVEHFHRIAAKKKSIELVVKNKIEDAMLFIDEDKISQVLNNYISNAIKYSPLNTTVTITIYSKIETTLCVEVSDQGQGIRPEEFDKVFKEFSQLSSRPTAGESSTGLGLFICKKIVEAHGGNVGFSSEYKKGSKFYFDLYDSVKN